MLHEGHGMRSAGLLVVALSATSCTKSSGSVGRAVATAATVAAIEVAAAAANRSITGCYTTCGYGTECNETTGLCEPQDECRSGPLASGANCGKTPEYLQATSGHRPGTTAAPADPAIDESCAGFCLSTEKCVVFRGDLDCVPK